MPADDAAAPRSGRRASERTSERVMVNKVIPFSLVDGPGSRCSVFLQGCNIRCAYCHNPETQAACINCTDCVAGCPSGALSLREGCVVWDEATCIGCDQCIHVCGHRASPKVRLLDAGEVFGIVRDYVPFIRGVTTSGGECMLHPRFLKGLFERCRGIGLETLIDTNGTIDFEGHEDLLAVANGVMLDVKAWDNGLFRRLTGSGNATVLKNLAFLGERDKLEEIRVVVVDGWNDPEDAIDGIADTLGELVGRQRLKLIRFRRFGVIGELSSMASPSDERMAQLERRARDVGFGEVVTA
ncbi:YjjW family glycine radical enzyme activase [Olsenella uli]|uniref:YjjW family glycine radical enzyme activase n=1 Tax=Olsenella uli TaxID=133926 RepID=UPI0024A9D89C|nr:YjjW family glycine radical enzyme activase [Olsenella uli]